MFSNTSGGVLGASSWKRRGGRGGEGEGEGGEEKGRGGEGIISLSFYFIWCVPYLLKTLEEYVCIISFSLFLKNNSPLQR